MASIGNISGRMRLPVIVAPLFLVSGPELVIASCEAGLVGTIPTQNARTIADLDAWMRAISDVQKTRRKAGDDTGAWGVAILVHKSYDRFDEELALIAQYQPDLVISALGSPRRVLETVHGYGGSVYADVMSPGHARKAVDAGADGLVLVCNGAGGHTGSFSPFAFLAEVRQFFSGPVVLGGAISDGRGIRAAQVLGADAVIMGTRFIPCLESQANDEYRDMLIRTRMEGVVATRSVTGVLCNWMRESLEVSGYDENRIASQAKIDFSDMHGENRPWKTIYSAGQGVGSIDRVMTVQALTDQLHGEYMECIGGESRFIASALAG